MTREPVQGISAEQLGLAYEGEYKVELHRVQDGASVTTPVTLKFEPTGHIGVIDDCRHQLTVQVSFSLTSDDSSLTDSGYASLSTAFGKLEPATFIGVGMRFRVFATFLRSGAAVIVNGTLESIDNQGSDFADFSNDSAGSAGAGGMP